MIPAQLPELQIGQMERRHPTLFVSPNSICVASISMFGAIIPKGPVILGDTCWMLRVLFHPTIAVLVKIISIENLSLGRFRICRVVRN